MVRRLFAIAAVVAVAAAVLVVRWWNGPSPEAEAQRYFDGQASGAVKVIDCVYVGNPDGSDFDSYACSVDARRRVPHPPDFPGIATVEPGRATYCFSIPRVGSPLVRFDRDAAPMRRAGRRELDCALG